MPSLLHPTHTGNASPGEKKKQDLIVVGTFALVVIAWITYKHMQGASSGAGTTAGVPGTVASASGGPSPDEAALTNSLNSIQGQLSDIATSLKPSSVPSAPATNGGTTGGATPPTPANPSPNGGGTSVPSLLPKGYGYFDTGTSTYTVASIAKRYGLTVDALKKFNPNLGITSGSDIVGKQTAVEVRSNAAPFDLAAYQPVDIPGTITGELVTSVVEVIDRGGTRWVFLDCGVFTGLVETLEEAARMKTFPDVRMRRLHELASRGVRAGQAEAHGEGGPAGQRLEAAVADDDGEAGGHHEHAGRVDRLVDARVGHRGGEDADRGDEGRGPPPDGPGPDLTVDGRLLHVDLFGRKRPVLQGPYAQRPDDSRCRSTRR